jgi:hypothetical protein
MHCHSATWRTENGKTVWLRLPKTPGRGPGAAQAADACLQYRTADRCSVSRSFLAWRSGVRTPAPRPAASAAGVAFPTDAAARPAVASRLPARPRRRGPGGEAQAVRRGSKSGQPERFGPASTRPLPTLMRKTGCLHRTPAGPATCAMPRTAIRVISDSDNLPDPRRKKPGPMFDPSGQPSISDVTCHGGRLSYHGDSVIFGRSAFLTNFTFELTIFYALGVSVCMIHFAFCAVRVLVRTGRFVRGGCAFAPVWRLRWSIPSC